MRGEAATYHLPCRGPRSPAPRPPATRPPPRPPPHAGERSRPAAGGPAPRRPGPRVGGGGGGGRPPPRPRPRGVTRELRPPEPLRPVQPARRDGALHRPPGPDRADDPVDHPGLARGARRPPAAVEPLQRAGHAAAVQLAGGRLQPPHPPRLPVPRPPGLHRGADRHPPHRRLGRLPPGAGAAPRGHGGHRRGERVRAERVHDGLAGLARGGHHGLGGVDLRRRRPRDPGPAPGGVGRPPGRDARRRPVRRPARDRPHRRHRAGGVPPGGPGPARPGRRRGPGPHAPRPGPGGRGPGRGWPLLSCSPGSRPCRGRWCAPPRATGPCPPTTSSTSWCRATRACPWSGAPGSATPSTPRPPPPWGRSPSPWGWWRW